MNHKLVKANILRQGDVIYTEAYNIFDIVCKKKQLTQCTCRYKVISAGCQIENYDMIIDLLIEKLQDGLYKV